STIICVLRWAGATLESTNPPRALGWRGYCGGSGTCTDTSARAASGSRASRRRRNNRAPGRGLLGSGWLLSGRGELADAADFLQKSLTLARDNGDNRTAAQALIALSFARRDLGRPDLSRPLLDECVKLSRKTGYLWAEGMALYLTGVDAGIRREA